MPFSTATVTFNVKKLLGNNVDARRTKVDITTNVPRNIVNTADGEFRIGIDRTMALDNGDVSFTVPTPSGTTNPTSWQTIVHIDAPTLDKRRIKESFGPFTITASAPLSDLVDEQEVPPEYLTTVTQQLDGKVDEAEAARAGAEAARDDAEALVISDLGTTDGQTRALIESTSSQTYAALSAQLGAVGTTAANQVAAAVNTVGGLADFLQLPGSLYGATGVNAAAFTQDAVTSAPNGDLYVVFWDSLKRPIIARWVGYLRTWQTFDLSTLPGNPLVSPVPVDGHNNLSVGVDGDGFIHVSGNHHINALRYVRSTAANDITAWETPTVSGVPGMVGTEEAAATYPAFSSRLSNGDLLFLYRNGESGAGDHILNRYAKATKTWSRVVTLFKGTAPVSPDECAYLNRLVRSSDGTLHLFYMWRESDLETSNHDISYIKSTDNGLTWTAADGTAMTLPITPADTASVVRAGYTSGLVNQVGASVDANGVPHACWWLNTGSGSTTAELHHFYYSGGTWHDDVVTALSVAASRPGMWSFQDKTWAIYSRDGMATAIRVAPTVGTPATLFPVPVHQWECQVDSNSSGRFRTLLTPSRSDQESVWGGVLTLDPSILDGYPPALVVPKPRTAERLEPPFLAAGHPMLVGQYYSPFGVRDGNGVNVARATMRAGMIVPARSCVINNAAIRVIGGGGAGSQYYVVVYDVQTNKLLARSAAQDGTVTGIITIPLSVRLTQGRPVYVGISTLGSATQPSVAALTGVSAVTIGGTGYNIPVFNLPLIGQPSASGATDQTATLNYVGVNASTGEGPPPSTITPAGTSRIPNIALVVAG